MTANSLHHSVNLGAEMGSCSLNTEFNSTSIIKCLLYARVCERGAKRDQSMPLGSWNLTKWMNDRMVLCRRTVVTQMEDWEEDQGRLRQQVTFHLPLVSTTEVRRCYFKWQPLSKVGGRNLEKPSIVFGRRQWHTTPVLLPGKSHGRRSLVGCGPWGRWVTFPFYFHALKKKMATHSSGLTWRIPGTAEPGGLPSMGSHRVGQDWSDLAAALHCTWE